MSATDRAVAATEAMRKLEEWAAQHPEEWAAEVAKMEEFTRRERERHRTDTSGSFFCSVDGCDGIAAKNPTRDCRKHAEERKSVVRERIAEQARQTAEVHRTKMAENSERMRARFKAEARPSVVYRIFRKDGALLYVGVAYSATKFSRLGQHEKDKQWWPEVDSVTFESYPDRWEAELAEASAIEADRPSYNRVGGRRDWTA